MKIIHSIVQLLKNEAFNGVSALIAILLILISPEYRAVLGILAILLFILVIIGHFSEGISQESNEKANITAKNILTKNIVSVTKHIRPIVSAIVVLVGIGVFAHTLINKNTRLHATIFGSWVDMIQVPYRDEPISLLSITPDGLMHDVFEKSKPFIEFSENGDATLTFHWIDEDDEYLTNGIIVEHAGQDVDNIIYEPAGVFISSIDNRNGGYTQFLIKQDDTMFLMLSDGNYVRMHFTNFLTNVYGKPVSVDIYTSFTEKYPPHFEGLTQP